MKTLKIYRCVLLRSKPDLFFDGSRLQLIPWYRLCFYTVESSEPSFGVTNLIKYYSMLRKTAEANDCGRITTANRMTVWYVKLIFDSEANRESNCNIFELQSRSQITPLRPVFEPLHQTIYVFFPVLGLNNARAGIRWLHFYSSRTYSSHEHRDSIGKK